MTDLITAYLDRLADEPTARGRSSSPATVRAQRADLAGFVAWWLDAHQLAAFDPALIQERDLRDWQRHRQVEDGAAATTINRAVVTLRAFFSWAAAQGHIRHNPAAQLQRLPAEDQAPPHLSPEAVTWLFRGTGGEDDPMRRARPGAADPAVGLRAALAGSRRCPAPRPRPGRRDVDRARGQGQQDPACAPGGRGAAAAARVRAAPMSGRAARRGLC